MIDLLKIDLYPTGYVKLFYRDHLEWITSSEGWISFRGQLDLFCWTRGSLGLEYTIRSPYALFVYINRSPRAEIWKRFSGQSVYIIAASGEISKKLGVADIGE
jgi:hypothetical protein